MREMEYTICYGMYKYVVETRFVALTCVPVATRDAEMFETTCQWDQNWISIGDRLVSEFAFYALCSGSIP